MAITKGWDATGHAASGASVATDVSGQPAAGSCIVVGVTNEFDGSETLSSITDNAGGNTYTLVPNTGVTQSAKRVAIYRAVNINTVSGFQVTATWSATTFSPHLSVVELIGADTTDPNSVATGQQQVTPGTGTDGVTSGSAGTPAQAGDFVFAAMRRYSGGGTSLISAGTGFTALHRSPPSSDYEGRSEYLIQGAAAAVAGTFTQADAGGTVCSVASFKAAVASASVEQEGFRWFNDDGDEDASTGAAAQDTNITAPAGETRRIRMLLNATGDPATTQFKLQYRKTGETPWNDVL